VGAGEMPRVFLSNGSNVAKLMARKEIVDNYHYE
jgi:hypothetical protein